MSSALTKADVEAVAALAHLELTDEEKILFTRQLAGILEHAEQVQEIDTSGVPPTSHVLAGYPVDRVDEVAPGLPRDAALANAPDTDSDAGLFKVPKVIG